MRIDESGIVFINEEPELRCIQAIQPTLALLSRSEYLCVFKYGSAMESVDSVLAQARSTDAGKTWSFEGFVPGTTQAGEEHRYSYFCPHIQKLRDGRLALLSVRFRRDDPGVRVYNPETGGCLPPDTTYLISDDGGGSWNGPTVIPIDGRYAYSGGPIVELEDSRWMVVFESWKPFHDPLPSPVRTFALFSADEGKCWGTETVVYEDPDAEKAFWDVSFVRLRDGALMGMAWTHDLKASRALGHHRLISEDNGRSWAPPVGTNREGQFTVTRELADGRLLGVYNVRSGDDAGIYACLSSDKGLSWDVEQRVQVWDALDGARLGAPKGTGFLDDLATFAFGKPDVCVLDERHALVVFWATRSCITHLRWARIDLEAKRGRVDRPMN